MVFSSIEFLFLFLPCVLFAYRIVPGKLRNALLLFASLLFYTWGGGALVLILIVSTFVDYFAGRQVQWARAAGRPGFASVGIASSVTVNLAMLGYFKYANFLVEQLNALGGRLGLGTIAWTTVVLPIGISFFTFQSMSYTIDIARGRTRPLTNPLDFALYVSLFPQLIAGPIVRYHELADQIRSRTVRLDGFAEGVTRFAHGLAKKVIVADSAGVIADAAFGTAPSDLTTAAAWLGIVAYSMQIYFDFSGYSDMAIGLGKMFGFTFPENFRRPYSAISITDFWRRWHITLSNWFRDYLYVPLGGNRVSERRTYFNLVVVFLLTGLWHGANWTFIVWGAYHGSLLIVERATGQRPTEQASLAALRRIVVFFLVMFGWVVFRAESIGYAASFLRTMLSPVGSGLPAAVAEASTTRALLITLLALGSVMLPRDFVGGISVSRSVGWRPALGRVVLMSAALPYAIVLVASGTFSPFLYFQF